MPNRKNNRKRASIRVLQIAVGLLGLIILGRLFQLQILDYNKYAPLSKQNSLRKEIVSPARGLIYDRNKNLLVDNEPIFSITITPARYDTSKTPLLAHIMDIPIAKVRKKIKKAQSYSWHRASPLFSEVGFKKFSLIQENIWHLPGIGHKIESKRHYPVDSLKASQILGYLGEISRKKYLQSNNYHLGDKVGKSGLELTYEKKLKGKAGVKYILTNAMGQSMGSYRNGKLDKSPQKGWDLYTSIDTSLQLLSEKLMRGKRGAVVALNPSNGAVLSMMSSPQYDVSKLSGRIDADYWQSLNTDSDDPLFDRAIGSDQPPGSTVKPLMALMGLQMKLITPQTTMHSPGYYYLGRRYGDHAPAGTYDIVRAIEESSNTFFFWLMNNMIRQKGLNKWHDLAASFGLGHKTNVDLPNETTGILPDSSYLNKILGQGNWGIGDQLSMGIGQGFMSASPLQMALVTSEIANGGYYVQPHVVKALKKSNGEIQSTKPAKKKIDWLKRNYLSVVQRGMRKVVTKGTARYYAALDSIKVAGKTGTAQNPHGEDHGWFICYAPYKNPKIAVAVLVENGGFGSTSAAPIASLLVEKYLTGHINRPRVLKYVMNFNPSKENE